MFGELQLVEKKINGGNPAVPGNDEISTSVCWLLTRAARYPLDPPAIAHFLRLGYWLISKVRVSSLDRARDSIDLVAAAVDASLGIVEHAIFGEDFVNRRAPARRVVLTEDVVKIAGQQGRCAVEHGCCFSSLDRVPLGLMYQAAYPMPPEGMTTPCRRSTLLHQRGSALADFLKCRFEATKLLRAQFREHSLHLQGMLSKGSGNEVFAAWGEGDDPHAPVFGALDPADQALRDEAVDSDTD